MKTVRVALRGVLFFSFCLIFANVAALAKDSRIRQPIDGRARVTLRGNTRPLPKGAIDLGPANSSLPTGRMLLVLRRSEAEDAELQQLLADLQDSKSPSYRKWLTPAQYADRFGVSAADAQTLASWLQGHGFTVNKVSAGRTSIEFSGTVGQLESAFDTSIHRYAAGGEEHLANTSDPAVPAALAAVVSGVIGLNDFFPQSSHGVAQMTPSHALYDQKSHLARPELTTSAGGNLLYVGPADAATIYDTPNSLNANFVGGHSYSGSGVTIAVVSDANINVSDVANYRSFFGLPANTPQVVVDGNDPGLDGNTTGDTQKALRDVEIAGALAPHANIVLYTAKNTTLVSGLYLALARAVDDNLSDVIEIGFSACEVDLGYGGNQFIEYEWQQAAVDGVTVIAAAGDSGSAGCDAANDAGATHGLAVNGYASTPYDIAVGGTDFDGLPGDFGGHVGSNGLALGYIPELPWNNSVAVGGNGELAANTPYKNSNGETNDFAGGGGASTCGVFSSPTSSACTGHPKPSWQSAAGHLNIPQDNVRDLPDVSLLAGTGQYGATWAVCGNDYDASGNPIADCAPGGGSAATIQGLGGTSAAASAFAGIMALVGQSQGSRLGQANYVLYNLANRAALYSGIFHDVATGNNSVVCEAGSQDCGSNDFLTGYNAGASYDQASGLGSVDVSELIANWNKATFLSSTTTLTCTVGGGPCPPSVPHGSPLTFHVLVTGEGGGIPTGTVGGQVNVDQTSNTYGFNVGFQGALNSAGKYQITVGNAPGGSYKGWASYSGDLDYSASSSVATPISLTVTPEDSTLPLILYDANGVKQSTSPTPKYAYGTYLSVDAKPEGISGEGIATGTVTFADNGTTLATRTDNINRRGFAEVPDYYWTGGTHSITAAYSGDNSFNPSSSASPLTFTIGQAATSLTVAATPSSLISGTITISGTVAATIANSGLPPSGTVSLVDSTSGVSLGSATLVAGTSKSTFTLTMQASQLALGANTLTATYAGDTNYTGSSGTTTATRLATLATTLTVTATPSSLISGTITISGTVAATIANSGLPPSGTVSLVDSTNGVSLGATTLVARTSKSTFTLAIQVSQLAPDANTLTATYGGDTNYAGSSGTTTATRLVPAATALTLTATPASLISGNVTVSGTVAATAASSGLPPSGTVTLVDSTNGVSLGAATLVAGTSKSTFSLTIQASQLALGANTLTATYAGDTNYAGSSGTTTATRLATVATALTMTATPSSLLNGSTAITGQITPQTSGAAIPPAGAVTLVDSTNGTQLGTAPLVAGTAQGGLSIGTFTFAVNATSLTIGANTLTATYVGDVNHSGSSGNVIVTLLATPPNPNFTISATNVKIATPGETAGNTSTITITPSNGFNGQVNLTTVFVSGPANAVSPATLALSADSVSVSGTAPATATATITTTALTYAMQRPVDRAPGSRWFEGGGIALAGLLLFGLPARRRRWKSMLGLLLFVIVGTSLGCGVYLKKVKTFQTTPGTYVFSVTGVDQATGLLKASTTVTVIVQ